MKILHTADWHLGKKLNGHSRHEEQIRVLDEICRLADAHSVDMVLVAGDLFDGPNPSSESTELFYKTLHRLSRNGSRSVVAIAGNHDSPDRIAAPEPLALACGIVLIGHPESQVPEFDTDSGIRVLHSEPGFLELGLDSVPHPVRLILTPFANEVRLKKYLGGEDGGPEIKDLLKEHWVDLARRHCLPDGINLLMTHLYFVPDSGPAEPESEDERSIAGIGGTDALPVSILPEAVQYVALGHIHKFWKVASRPCPVVYSSSPLCYSLSESGQEKFAVLVELEPGKPAEYQKLPLTQGKPVLRKSFDSADEAVAWLDQNPEVLVELTLVSDSYMNAEDSRRLYAAHSGILDVIPQTRGKVQEEETGVLPADVTLDKMTLFVQFFKQRKGQEPSEELKELFHEILNT